MIIAVNLEERTDIIRLNWNRDGKQELTYVEQVFTKRHCLQSGVLCRFKSLATKIEKLNMVSYSRSAIKNVLGFKGPICCERG